MTEMERLNIENDIAMYKQLLSLTDYKTLKYAEGAITEEDYTAVKAERQSWRDKINELEARLADGGAD